MSERQNVLHVENATMQFGGVVAVNNLTLDVNKGEIVALIGPNGAGKTTAFNVITGVYQPTNGEVSFMGKPMIRNHPQGKMQKLYKGQNAVMYTGDYKFQAPEGSELSGEALKNAIEQRIKEKGDLSGTMAAQGTTPRRVKDLIGSLCDLTSGSGDKGTPIVLVQGYFDNYTM